jgi:hypothetical protein
MGLYFLFGTLSGIVIGAVLASRLSAKKRAAIPIAIWMLCVLIGFGAVLFSLMNSTAPSFAHRITVTGKAFDCIRPTRSRDYRYFFTFQPESGGPLHIGSRIVVPPMCWTNSNFEAGSTYRIVYLDDTERDPANEAIDIQVLTGRNAGWQEKLDARPFGFWLATPAGAILGYLGLYAVRYKKTKVESGAE